MTRRDRIDEAAARIDAVLDLIEREPGDDSSAIARFALYRVAHRRLVLGGFISLVRWQTPPFPEESDEKSAP